jgi:hypothetical protein
MDPLDIWRKRLNFSEVSEIFEQRSCRPKSPCVRFAILFVEIKPNLHRLIICSKKVPCSERQKLARRYVSFYLGESMCWRDLVETQCNQGRIVMDLDASIRREIRSWRFHRPASKRDLSNNREKTRTCLRLGHQCHLIFLAWQSCTLRITKFDFPDFQIFTYHLDPFLA